METERQASCTAFFDSRRIAGGSFQDVERQIAERVEPAQRASVLIFNDQNGKRIEYGEDSPPPDIPAAPRGPGRPRLGVVAREITLLPRHWAWLNAQPGGASVALRRLIEESRRQGGSLDRKRRAQEACYGFITAIAGDLPGYEAAARALFAGQQSVFTDIVSVWPKDVGDYAVLLARRAFD